MADRPSGTVTFLFTDVEGSTRLWEEQPAAMEEALERHDEILRSVIESHGGYVFSTAGDAFAAAFARSASGVEAAVEAQQLLGAEAWPEGAVVRVRMGLHTGEAQERAGDYFGTALNRAARLMSVAHGGQVLLSGSTERVVRDRADGGWSVRTLGEVRLRGLGRAEDVFEVWAPGMEEGFPPLAPATSARGRLPAATTDLVGREEDLNGVLKLLAAGGGLVTLVGPGGVGKTRLSVEVGSELGDKVADGVWFVELAPVSADDGVAPAVAEVLGVQEAAGQSLVASIVGALRGRDLLLVIDNCEHVMGAVRELLGELVRECPTVAVLATSREALGLRGERVLPIAPLWVGDETASLDESPAVRLFVDRVVEADSSAVIDHGSLPVVGEICRRLDGMPLALELAAARVRGLGLEGLSDRLDERFRLLRNRSADDRHQTLRATVGWSYDLLEPWLQLLFCRASVFAGGFTLDTAEQVLAGGDLDEIDVVDGLAELVDKSMVQIVDTDTGRRYRLLETMRQFGTDNIASGDLDETRSRYVDYYVAWVVPTGSGIFGSDPAQSFVSIANELDNLRECYRICTADSRLGDAARLVRHLFYFSSMFVVGEPLVWASELAEKLDPADELYDEVLACAAGGAIRRGDRQRAFELVNRVEQAQQAGQLEPSPFWAAQVGVVFWFSNQTSRAIELYEQALPGARAAGDVGLEATALGTLAMAQDSFDHDLAERTARHALEIGRANNVPMAVCHGLLPLAGAIVHRRPDEALPIIDELLDTASRVQARWYYATGLRLRAHALSRAGRLEEASETYADALDLNGVGDFGELLWYTVLNVLEHLVRTQQLELATSAAAAITRAPAAPSDDQVKRALARLHRHLEEHLDGEALAQIELQAAAMPLAEFLNLLDRGLRDHAAGPATT